MTATVFPFPNTQPDSVSCGVCEDSKRMAVTAPGFTNCLAIPCPACTARGLRLLLSLIGWPTGGVA